MPDGVRLHRFISFWKGLQADTDTISAWLEQHAHLPILVRTWAFVARDARLDLPTAIAVDLTVQPLGPSDILTNPNVDV